jgi:hypothetical protein
MDRWDIQKTRDLIAQRFGRHQLDLVNPCFQSIVDRQQYARYHYHEIMYLLDYFISEHLTETSLLKLSMGMDDDARDEFDLFMIKIGAHVLSCVQNMHSLADILAHAVYFSLGINLTPNTLTENKISINTVINKVRTITYYQTVFILLNELQTGGHYEHLNALSNHSKHRSIVRSLLNEDFTKDISSRHSLKISNFKYRGTSYPEVSVRKFIASEYERCSKLVIDIGNALNHALLQTQRINGGADSIDPT